jgi:hypothetical protein
MTILGMGLGVSFQQPAKNRGLIQTGLAVLFDGADFTNTPLTTLLKDRTGNGHEGKISGFGYTVESGSDNQGGIVIDGIDDKITITNSTSTGIELSKGATFSMILAHKEVSNGYELLRSNAFNGFKIDASKKDMSIWHNNGYSYINLPDLPALNVLYKLDVVKTFEGKAKVYINGVLQGEDTRSIPMDPSQTDFVINKAGVYKHIAIYTRGLTEAEIKHNYDVLMK